jgi:hypothetical protein
MSKKIKKKVIAASDRKTTPTVSKTKSKLLFGSSDDVLLFGKQHYILMASGIALMFIGYLLMLGGHMPDPDTWDPDIIYSFRRTVLSPVCILAGLIVLIVAVFKK